MLQTGLFCTSSAANSPRIPAEFLLSLTIASASTSSTMLSKFSVPDVLAVRRTVVLCAGTVTGDAQRCRSCDGCLQNRDIYSVDRTDFQLSYIFSSAVSILFAQHIPFDWLCIEYFYCATSHEIVKVPSCTSNAGHNHSLGIYPSDREKHTVTMYSCMRIPCNKRKAPTTTCKHNTFISSMLFSSHRCMQQSLKYMTSAIHQHVPLCHARFPMENLGTFSTIIHKHERYNPYSYPSQPRMLLHTTSSLKHEDSMMEW